MIKSIWHFSFTVSGSGSFPPFLLHLLRMKLLHRQDQSNEYTKIWWHIQIRICACLEQAGELSD